MPTLTLSSLTARVYASLDGNTALYTPPEITAAINEAIQVLNLLTGFLQVSIQLATPSIANRLWYHVPRGILIPTRVSYENSALQPISLDKLGQANSEWSTATTATIPLPVTYWIRRGLDRFGLWPADGYGGGVLNVTGIAEPVPLQQPGDAIGFPNDILQAFDLYTTHVLQLKESTALFIQGSRDYVAFQSVVKRVAAWQGLRMPRYWVESEEQE